MGLQSLRPLQHHPPLRGRLPQAGSAGLAPRASPPSTGSATWMPRKAIAAIGPPTSGAGLAEGLVQRKEVHRSSARVGKQRMSELRKASRSRAFLGVAFIQGGLFLGQAGQMSEPSEEL